MTHNNQTYRLRCASCDVVVRFGDGTAVEHVSHGVSVEWFDIPASEPAQRQLFAEVNP